MMMTRKSVLLLSRNLQCHELLLLPVINVLTLTNAHAYFFLPLLLVVPLLFLFTLLFFFFFLFWFLLIKRL
jgi:hypothetical protein